LLIIIKKKESFNISSNRQSYKIAILAPLPPLSGGMTQIAESLSNNLINDGHKVIKIQLGKGLMGLFPIPTLYFQFIHNILRCDIIHIISASGSALWIKDLPAIIIARLFKKKVILNFVGGKALDYYPKWPWYKRLPFKWASVVVLPTDIFVNLLKKYNPLTKFYKIPHVVDVKSFKNNHDLKKEVPILLAAKSLEDYAGFDILLDVFSSVKEKIHNAELWIVGDGPIKDDLKDQVKEMELKDVRFFGNIDHKEMPDIMQKATIFVHASKYESFGIVLVEAMASMLPVVSFDVGGISEVIINSKTGYLIPYRDNNEFIDKILDLITNEKMKKELGENGIVHSEKFSWEIIRNYWYDLYSDSGLEGN